MKVSVCVPVSRGDTVPVLIRSILRQTWTDWELIAVGQGSLDDPSTQQICNTVQEFAAQDERIKYIHISESGASRAKNAAIRAASGDIIAGIDDDSEAHPDWLENMVSYFEENPDINFVGGALLKPPKSKKGLAVCPAVDAIEAVYDPNTSKSPPPGWTWVTCNIGFRKGLFEQIGMYDEYLGPGSTFPVAEDTDVLLRLEAAGIKMATTPKLVVYHTYGYRYGIKAFTRHQYNYSYGNGGLAAKLTLAGDRRGLDWMQQSRKDRLLGPIKQLRPDRFLRGLVGWYAFKKAYDHCLREYQVENNVLVPRNP